jgi:hypothetical protein
MTCLKNLLRFVRSLAKTVAHRLMSTIGFRFVVSRAKRCFATPAKKNTTSFANLVRRRLGPEATAPKTAQSVHQKQCAKLVAANTRSQIISIVIIALRGAATSTKQSCTLAATTWLRLKEMATSAANATQNSRPMSTTLISQDALKRLIEKGATTT